MIRDQSKFPVGFLWNKEDRNGRSYQAGVISLGLFGEIPVVIFKEEHKDKDTSPDYIVRLATE